MSSFARDRALVLTAFVALCMTTTAATETNSVPSLRRRRQLYSRSTSYCYADDPLSGLGKDCTNRPVAICTVDSGTSPCRCPDSNGRPNDFRNMLCGIESGVPGTEGYAASYCSDLTNHYGSEDANGNRPFLGSDCRDTKKISGAWLTRSQRPLKVERPWYGCWFNGYTKKVDCQGPWWNRQCMCMDERALLGEACKDGFGGDGECEQNGAAAYSDGRLVCADYGDQEGSKCRPAFHLYGASKTCECDWDFNLAGFICGAKDDVCGGHACVWGTNGVHTCDFQSTGNDW